MHSPDLEHLGLEPVIDGLPASARRFPDGGEFRVEIPSVKGPEMLAAVIESARDYGITVNRVSQGSEERRFLTTAELGEMGRARSW